MRVPARQRRPKTTTTPGPEAKSDLRSSPTISPMAMRTPTSLQPKLTVNSPGDRYEQEADRVADQVMRMPDPELQRQPLAEEEEDLLQMKPIAGTISPLMQRQTEPIEEEAADEEEFLQAKAAAGEPATVSSGLQNQIMALQGGGQPLSPSERHFFEPRFGTDFSQVRIHTDGQAAEAASAVNARAFTLGRDVVFGGGEYQQGASEGRRLLAHELTHVVQQISSWNRSREKSGRVNCVKQMLTGSGLHRAQRNESTGQPFNLNNDQRQDLVNELRDYLVRNYIFFNRATDQVKRDIQGKRAADVYLFATILRMAITYVIPKLALSIAKLAASKKIILLAPLIRFNDKASAIASTIGEASKRAAAPAVKAILGSSRSSLRDFFNALIEGYSKAQGYILEYVGTHCYNRSILSDEDLLIYVANWNPEKRTIGEYAKKIRDIYNRWLTQVHRLKQIHNIGPLRESRSVMFGLVRYQTGIVWVRHPSGDVLVSATTTNGKLHFNRFIDADLKDVALARAEITQPRGIQTIPGRPPYIFNMPSSIPDNAARTLASCGD